MKIRTDFVTNSSSSSFVVSITIVDKSGAEYSVKLNPDDGSGNGSANLDCSSSQLANADSVEALLDLLSASLQLQPDNEEEDVCESAQTFADFCSQVKNGVSGIGTIKQMVLERSYFALGEFASCFGANFKDNYPELYEQAEKICNSDGEEKAAAKEKMKELLQTLDATVDCWPTGFLGEKAAPIMNLDKIEGDDKIEEFAKAIIAREVSNDDEAVETIRIDFESKSVDAKAEYFVAKEREW